MNERRWNRVDHVLPPENRVVATLSQSGIEQPLKLVGNLWFVPDGSMYVYYTPLHWREVDE